MASTKRQPYMTKEFWQKNKFWENDLHGRHDLYEEFYNQIMEEFNKVDKADKIK